VFRVQRQRGEPLSLRPLLTRTQHHLQVSDIASYLPTSTLAEAPVWRSRQLCPKAPPTLLPGDVSSARAPGATETATTLQVACASLRGSFPPAPSQPKLLGDSRSLALWWLPRRRHPRIPGSGRTRRWLTFLTIRHFCTLRGSGLHRSGSLPLSGCRRAAFLLPATQSCRWHVGRRICKRVAGSSTPSDLRVVQLAGRGPSAFFTTPSAVLESPRPGESLELDISVTSAVPY
jgi:hypothetical protein